MKSSFFLALGGCFALLGVVARSLSSHAIYELLANRGKLDNFNLAADYLLAHGIGLVAVAILCQLYPQGSFARAGYALLVGTLLFSGTVLYKSLAPMGAMGILTPIGGAILFCGWGLFIWAALTTGK
jgi:uncharacterized membrane protein YgdD (TMEM256/DUF423 family)